MAKKDVRYFGGIDTYSNPFSLEDGAVLHCVNLDSHPLGAKTKRPGYNTYLNNPGSATVDALFSWQRDDGTTLYTYMAQNGTLWYSAQGTSNWTDTGQTITPGNYVGYAVLDDTLIAGDGNGTPFWTTTGTTFNEATAAPVGAQFFSDYQGRIYTHGTTSYVFYSTVGTAEDWTSDSSSLFIPGPGKVSNVLKASDRLMISKNSGAQFRWDGNELVDLATKLGPSSPYSIGEVEDFRFWLNRLGVFSSNSNKPQLISNPIQRQIYNNSGSAVAGSIFDTAPGVSHQYGYYTAVGTTTDDFTGITISDNIIKYNYQKNEFCNYQFANNPTAFHSYKDANGVQQMIFGDATGQCYQIAGTATTDNSTAIETSLLLMLHANAPHMGKDWRGIEFYTSPGCGAKVQYAVANYVPSGDSWHVAQAFVWRELGDLTSGYNEFHFPSATRGRFMFLRIYESSKDKPWTIYSLSYDYDAIKI